MKSVCPIRAMLSGLLLAALSFVTVGATANLGRPFSGYYDVSGVQVQGEVVQVTLHVKLFNHGDEDVKSVIVTLLDNSPFATLRGNFQPLKIWKSQQFVEMSQEFDVPKREYALWSRGPGQPNLVILFQDIHGKDWRRSVQVSRRPMVHPDSE